MFIKMILKEKRVVRYYTLIIFLVMAFVFMLVTLFLQINADQMQRNEVRINGQSLADAEKAYIASKISESVSDVLYIADSLLLSEQVHTDYAAIEQQWIAFSNRKTIYDQMRYIDLEGNEVIRINYHTSGAIAVAEANLQNKKDRYYFINTISLQKNQVFISKLDLNIENGEIEQPIKPMLRLATPFYGNGGDTEGMIILNYTAHDLLWQVQEIASTGAGEIFLLNLDGYWLYNSEDSSKEWAFMVEDRMNESFAYEYPEEWEIISSNGDGFLNTENGIFSYTSMVLDSEITSSDKGISLYCDSGVFYIVSYISSDSEAGALFSDNIFRLIAKVLGRYVSVYFLLSGFAFILAAFIAINKAQRKEIKYFSEYDAMTGVYNRRSGYGKLNALKRDASKKNCSITVCFIDINSLKEVNDFLGHDTGDELLVSVAGVIKDSVRDNDFVARLGGDEFLIVFDGLDEEGAENVWARIVQKYEQINAEDNRKYIISVSHGIGTFACNSTEEIDTMINQADQKMYNEKREIKKYLKVIR